MCLYHPLHCRQVPSAGPRGRTSFAAAAYAKQDQEDAQEFLQYLLDHAHLVRACCLLCFSLQKQKACEELE